ncbi:hypothetical protein [Mesorhizobium sp.]|uniref:hypothetical protein n=1 Tax=Mesorhizobium sp. TaxID=1871066 RepID=UPI002579D582|nr:hypothetical protein [Mesorhizobium sp.]
MSKAAGERHCRHVHRSHLRCQHSFDLILRFNAFHNRGNEGRALIVWRFAVAADVHQLAQVLIKALGQAVTWERLSRNPARATTPPKFERKKMLAYDVGQTATLLETLRSTRMFIPVLLAVTCGLRRGEILALRWRQSGPRGQPPADVYRRKRRADG